MSSMFTDTLKNQVLNRTGQICQSAVWLSSFTKAATLYITHYLRMIRALWPWCSPPFKSLCCIFYVCSIAEVSYDKEAALYRYWVL